MRDSSVPFSRRGALLAGLGLAVFLGLERSGVASAARVAESVERLRTGAAMSAGTFPWVARHGLTSERYQAEFDRLAKEGYRLIQVDGYEMGGQAGYAAIWEHAPGPPQFARHGLTEPEYRAEYRRLEKEGYRLVHVAGYEVAGKVYFAAIWELTGGPHLVAQHDMPSERYQAEFDRLLKEGYRLIHVDGYGIAGKAHFAAIWEKVWGAQGPDWEARHDLTGARYQAEFDELTKKGYRPFHVSGYTVGGTDLYAAIWVRGAGPAWSARHGVEGADYQGVFDEHQRDGYRPARVSGYGSGSERFAGIWLSDRIVDDAFAAVHAVVDRHMRASGVAGVSLAIARRGALVFARGYGLANRETGERLTERHLMRIASVSKPITAVAVMRLVEAGLLTLDRRVLGAGGILGTRYGSRPYGAGLQAITVRHLLQHTAGGWTNDGDDPMFGNPAMNHDQLIGWVLDNRPLQHTPGTTHLYSNFGYCLLGRIIEQVTGEPYADFVRRSVLTPSGITNMHLAGNTRAERRPDEVVYYGTGDPYGIPARRMDSHGGWLASPVDVVRFALRADGFPTVPDLLRPDTIATMTAPSAAEPAYACGWGVNTLGNWWHSGRLIPYGTESILARTSNEFCWAALANGNGVDLDTMMWEVFQQIAVWPSHDLF
ncbi:serine hydrolase [Streptosporangium amethystogenes subsp. fukuiense]|uniref:Serine hydrolase n=1 Tax=Streptosporangium amethystogenes subsp. fukuiense TaxID=698418 RepID=A0ABW2T2B8_9ACTN